MGYIKVSWPDCQKYTELPDSVLDQFIEDDLIVFGNDGSYLIDEDFIDELDELIESGCEIYEPEESELPEETQNKIKEISKKYAEVSNDIKLKVEIPLSSRKSNVYAFYIYEGWIYLLDDNGNDIDPSDVEEDFLEKFLDYISDENNLEIEK